MTTKEPVNMVCAANASFALPLCVMLVSLVDNFDPERDLIIHIISNDATEEMRKNVRRSIEMNRPGLSHVRVEWHSIGPEITKNFPIPEDRNYPSDAYSRVFAPLLLPESCERAIYLDCDLVVLADLSRLYDTTAHETSLLQAPHLISPHWVSSKFGVFNYKELGIPANTPYFCTGVMVMNLKGLRERNVISSIIEYAVRNKDRIDSADQGAMNAILYNDWTPIDRRWNQDTDILYPEIWECIGKGEEWRRTKDDPYIVHYTGPYKPWQPGRRGPRNLYFFRYLRKTAYKDALAHDSRWEERLGPRLYYQLWQWRNIFRGLLRGRRSEV